MIAREKQEDKQGEFGIRTNHQYIIENKLDWDLEEKWNFYLAKNTTEFEFYQTKREIIPFDKIPGLENLKNIDDFIKNGRAFSMLLESY
jgi:hypothetical protein